MDTHHVILEVDSTLTVNPRYVHIKEIYRSSASPTVVDLCLDSETGQELILKRITKARIFSEAQRASAYREAELHFQLRHQNIVELFDWGETPDELCLLMEYLPVNDYFVNKVELNNMPFYTKEDGGIGKLRSFSFDILQGLVYLHSLGFIHLDLKPANLLLKVDVSETEYPLVKICDLGLIRHVGDDGGVVIEKRCGTDKYIPPEVKDGAWITSAADIWSFGMILHILTVGFYPYALNWKPGQPLKFSPRYWKKYAETGLPEFIELCLRLNPAERLTATQALEHKWIRTVDS
jgi:serine/threonine protein kinase